MALRRPIIRQANRFTIFQIIGTTLIILSILAMLTIGLLAFFGSRQDNEGAFVAVSFIFLLLGLALVFPDMLKSSAKGSLSTMRVLTFMVVGVFLFLCVKIGWSCKSFADFKIDSTWGIIITACLGSKAAQSFGEANAARAKASAPQPTQNTGPGPAPGPDPNPNNRAIHDISTLGNRPPKDPPPAIAKTVNKLP